MFQRWLFEVGHGEVGDATLAGVELLFSILALLLHVLLKSSLSDLKNLSHSGHAICLSGWFLAEPSTGILARHQGFGARTSAGPV